MPDITVPVKTLSIGVYYTVPAIDHGSWPKNINIGHKELVITGAEPILLPAANIKYITPGTTFRLLTGQSITTKHIYPSVVNVALESAIVDVLNGGTANLGIQSNFFALLGILPTSIISNNNSRIPIQVSLSLSLFPPNTYVGLAGDNYLSIVERQIVTVGYVPLIGIASTPNSITVPSANLSLIGRGDDIPIITSVDSGESFGGTSVTVTNSVVPKVGQLVFLLLNDYTGTNTTTTVAIPEGFEEIEGIFPILNTRRGDSYRLFWKVASASEPASYTITFSVGRFSSLRRVTLTGFRNNFTSKIGNKPFGRVSSSKSFLEDKISSFFIPSVSPRCSRSAWLLFLYNPSVSSISTVFDSVVNETEISNPGGGNFQIGYRYIGPEQSKDVANKYPSNYCPYGTIFPYNESTLFGYPYFRLFPEWYYYNNAGNFVQLGDGKTIGVTGDRYLSVSGGDGLDKRYIGVVVDGFSMAEVGPYTVWIDSPKSNVSFVGIAPTVKANQIEILIDVGGVILGGYYPEVYLGVASTLIYFESPKVLALLGGGLSLFYPPISGVLSFTGYDPGTGWEVPDPYNFTLVGLQPIASTPKVPGVTSLTFATYIPDVWPYWDYPDQVNLVLGTIVPIVHKGVFVTPLPKANITIEVSSTVDVYTVFAQIQVEVVDIYTDTANITVEVTNVVDVYTVTASITIVVVELAYTLTAPIVVDVVPIDAYADGGSWRPVVIVNSVDVSAYCYGSIDIEINEGESAIADLEFIAGVGPINLVSWNGKPVVIDYAKKDSNGNAIYNRRIFTGIVDTPSYDIINGRLKLRCTTDLQNYCRRVGRTVLDGVIGGRYSDAVFDSTVDDWEYAQNRVSTVLGNVDFDVYRNLRLISWESKVSPDVTLTESTILDGSLSVNFAARRDIINKVNVTMNYQFPRLKKRVMTIGFNYPFSLSEILLNGYTVPTRQMIKDAIRNSGWEIAAKIGWTPVPEGPVSVNLGNGKTGVWVVNDSNLNGIVKKPPTKPGANDQVVVYPVATGDKDAADKLCFGYTAFVRKRYAQNIKETYDIVVKNDFSIGKLGELTDKLEAGIDVDFDVGSWESWRPPSNPEDETISSVESGLPGAVAFQSSAPYVAGQVVRPSSGENGFKYLVTVGGVTASEPAWPTKSGATVKSGTVTFKAVYQTATGADLEPEPIVPDPKVGESYIDYEGGTGEDRTALGNAITTLIDMGKRVIYGSHRKTVVKCKVPINPDLDCSKTVRVQTTHFVCKGKVKKVHHVLDMDSGGATSEIEIAILIVDGTGFPKETTTTVPPKPEVTLQEGSSEIFIPTIGGATHQRVWVGSAWYSGPLRKDMYGYMTNVAKFTQDWKEGAPIYPVQYSVLMPGIDDGSRDLNKASVGSVYEANLVEDEFVVS